MQSVVAGFVHRIHRACSTWNNFHESLLKAKCILERQYPPDFYEPIIQKALDKILNADDTLNDNEKDFMLNCTFFRTSLYSTMNKNIKEP